MFKYTFHKKVAETGNLEEFKKLYQKDSSLLYRVNIKGSLPIHCSVAKNKILILNYIYEKTGSGTKFTLFYIPVIINNKNKNFRFKI